MANPTWFDEFAYLNSKLNQLTASGVTGYTTITQVKAAIESAGMTTYQHFASFSLAERTSPNDYFNTNEYLAAKAVQLNTAQGVTTWTAERVALAFQNAGYTNAYDHFAAFGWTENVNPSNAFDVSAYLDLKAAATGLTVAEVTAAFVSAGFDPISHYLAVGSTETGISVTAVPDAEQVADDTSSGSAGQTFTLTTGTDSVAGTSGNDTIIGDVGTTVTVQGSDQIAGGAGTDTYKIYGAFTAATSPVGNVSAIETLWLAQVANAAQNLSAYTKAATGIETIQIADASLLNGQTITTTAGQSLSLATGASSAVTAGTVTWAGSATDSSLSLALDGYQAIAGGTPAALTVTGAAATTLNIASTGSTNKVGTLTGPTTVTSHVITGDKALTYATAAADSAALNSINASANTGGVNVNVSAAVTKAAFTFTGGTGNDTIKFANDEFGTLTAGTQLAGGDGTGDKIGIFDTALTAAETAKINAATGFEVLGLNAAITLDASTLTSIKQFSIDTTALTQVVNNMATGSKATVTAAAPTSLTLAGATGVSDVTIALGTSSSTGNITVGTLVTTGLTNVALSSNGTGTHTNTITTLTNSDNSNFTVTGSQDLTMTLATGTAIGSQVNGSAMTGKLNVTGSSGAAYNDILIGGSNTDTINGLKGADVMTGGAGADTFSFTATAGANANGAAFGTFDTITDFVAGTDKLQFAGVVDAVSGQQAAVQTAVTALAAGSTATQIATAMATASTTNLGVSFAVFEGNTYALFETTGASTGVIADDVFIKLTGVTTAPTFAADVIA